MSEYGIQIGKVFFAGLLSLILTTDLVVGLQALYYWQVHQAETTQDFFERPMKLESLLTVQRTRLTDYRVVDAKKETVTIPIDRAMDLVVAELSAKDRTGEPQ
jgi:hypothetical protein